MAPSAFIHRGVRLRRIATNNGRTISMVDFLMRQYVAFQNLLVVENDEEGQGLAEYALILALIAILAVAALIFLGDAINDILSDIGSTLNEDR
jgi:pilus assembly protein Flp/PilA